MIAYQISIYIAYQVWIIEFNEIGDIPRRREIVSQTTISLKIIRYVT